MFTHQQAGWVWCHEATVSWISWYRASLGLIYLFWHYLSTRCPQMFFYADLNALSFLEGPHYHLCTWTLLPSLVTHSYVGEPRSGGRSRWGAAISLCLYRSLSLRCLNASVGNNTVIYEADMIQLTKMKWEWVPRKRTPPIIHQVKWGKRKRLPMNSD